MNLEILKSEIDNIKLKTNELKSLVTQFKKIIILGNGGSNAISSHISVDYTKFLKIPTTTFTNTSMLTAYTNDYGQDKAYKYFLSDFYTPDTLIIFISSSGNSKNILNAASYCETCSIPFMALSGFDSNNKLNQTNAIFKYHVPHNSYGVVELAHEIMLHSIINN
jgi:D-sedoheptulose 7-phosphate isomerase